MSKQCRLDTKKRKNGYCNNALASFTPDKWLASTGQVGHLFDGLTYLLRAAQEWQIQKDIEKLGVEIGYPVEVFAMDSVFLRTRSLFEFFTGKGRSYCHAQCLFDLDKQLKYPRYTDQKAGRSSWENVLHIGSMHFQNRGGEFLLTAYDGGKPKHLNEMPADFAKGILDVWRAFEAALQAKGYTDLCRMAEACRRQAAIDAAAVVESVENRAGAYLKLSASHAKLTKLFEDQTV